MSIRFAERTHIYPVYAPAATSDTESDHIKLENAQWVSFLVQLGTLADDTAAWEFKPYSAAAATTAAGDTALGFTYRLSSAVGTDNWGDATAVAAGSSISIAGTHDNKLLLIDVDPSVIPALDADAEYIYLDINMVADQAGDAGTMGIVAFVEDRYPQAEHITLV